MIVRSSRIVIDQHAVLVVGRRRRRARLQNDIAFDVVQIGRIELENSKFGDAACRSRLELIAGNRPVAGNLLPQAADVRVVRSIELIRADETWRLTVGALRIGAALVTLEAEIVEPRVRRSSQTHLAAAGDRGQRGALGAAKDGAKVGSVPADPDRVPRTRAESRAKVLIVLDGAIGTRHDRMK